MLHVEYLLVYCFFFFNDTATTEIYTLSLHDALPIWIADPRYRHGVRCLATVAEHTHRRGFRRGGDLEPGCGRPASCATGDRKSTRLNSSHSQISYAVFCLKKKKTTEE